jgi:hypothetical protein
LLNPKTMVAVLAAVTLTGCISSLNATATSSLQGYADKVCSILKLPPVKFQMDDSAARQGLSYANGVFRIKVDPLVGRVHDTPLVRTYVTHTLARVYHQTGSPTTGTPLDREATALVTTVKVMGQATDKPEKEVITTVSEYAWQAAWNQRTLAARLEGRTGAVDLCAAWNVALVSMGQSQDAYRCAERGY